MTISAKLDQQCDLQVDGSMAPISLGLMFQVSATEFGMVAQLVLPALTLTKWPDVFLVVALQSMQAYGGR